MAIASTFEAPAFGRAIWPVLGIAAGTGLLAGLLPALLVARRRVDAVLQSSRTVARASGRVGQLALIGQVALSLTLVVGAGILAVTLIQPRTSDLGFRADDLTLVSLRPQPGSSDAFSAGPYYENLVARLRAVPGVQSAALADLPGGLGRLNLRSVLVSPGPSPDAERGSLAVVVRASPELREVLGIELIAGRDLRWDDRADSAPVAMPALALRAD